MIGDQPVCAFAPFRPELRASVTSGLNPPVAWRVNRSDHWVVREGVRMEKKYVVRLTSEERERLKALVSKGRASARKIGRAQVLLKVDADGPNWTDQQAVEAFSIRANTVADIRRRCVEEGLDRALDRKRPDEPPTRRKLDGAGEARLIALACGEPTAGRGARGA